MEQAYLIIDIGTGNIRIAIATPSGEILAIQRDDVRYIKDHDYPESIYFDPDAMWQQLIELTQKALSTLQSPVSITAVTATSQREGIVLIGHQGQSLIGLPNIDHRGREWESMIADPHRVYQLTGRYPTSLFSAFKVVGVRERKPHIASEFATFLSISDWVQYKFSGVQRYEPSQASETLLYDVAQGDWSGELCWLFDIKKESLPEIATAGTVLGKIIPEEALRFGADQEALVIVGGADTQLAIKSTMNDAGEVIIVSGTTTPVVKITDSYETDTLERTWTGRHTEPERFILETNAGVTGLNYQRLKEIFYPNESYEVIEEEVRAVASQNCVGALGSLLANEKVPLTRGGFVFDVPVSHLLSRAHFVQATLWDIACSIYENYTSLNEVSPHTTDHVWACGGGLQSRILREYLAGLLNKTVLMRSNYRQASVVGGIILCNKALGLNIEQQTAIERAEPANQAWITERYEQWKANRHSLKTQMSK